MAPIEYIPRTREMYPDYPPYRWVVNEDVPWAPLTVPLSRCRVALATSGGVHHADQEPFHTRDDTSYREISSDADITELRVSHFGYRTEDAQRDPNCVFPIERMRELAAEGVIGELADPAYSFMGGIYSARRAREELASPLAELLVAKGVDVLFLVPA
jgi:D-proline reductase (dithiol) PrdB